MDKKSVIVKISVFAISLGVLFANAACKTIPDSVVIPMTPGLIEEIGPENMSKVAYFLSKDVRLERYDSFKEQILFEQGIAVRVEKDVKDIIQIDTKTAGAAALNMLTEAAHINYRVLGIEFEEDTSKIGFAVPLADPEARFDVLFDDDEMGTIKYGNNIYRLVYSGDERPYLMVRVSRKIIPENTYRKASGRKFD